MGCQHLIPNGIQEKLKNEVNKDRQLEIHDCRDIVDDRWSTTAVPGTI